MAVAFTREEDVEAAAAHLPERPISPHRNLVTKSGLDALESGLAAAQAAFTAAQSGGDIRTNRTAMAQAARDLRYYRARRASAELVTLPPNPHVVQFGTTVTVLRHDGRRQRFRIVGEDEADAAQGSISYASPLARALMGKSVGDVVLVGGREVELEAIDSEDQG